MNLEVTVNGEPTTVAAASTIFDVVADVAGASVRGVAVARNGEVVPRSVWPDAEVQAGDVIEVLNAAQGG